MVSEIKDLIKKENCFVVEDLKDWEEAIDFSLEPLIKEGYCTTEYKTAVYENIRKYGPYFVICEELALIHASNSTGVEKSQISLTVLRKPIKFEKSDYNVRILIALVAENSTSHMEVIKTVANIFVDQNKIENLLRVKSAEELYTMFIENSKEDDN